MRLSVIIPTHNRGSLLREAISSVVRQNIARSEVIVCDDGSTEDMSTTRDHVSVSESQVIWSRTEACQGAQVARNRGLALARGDVVLFLDSDDVLADEGMAPLLHAFEANPALNYAWGKVIRTDEQLKPLPGSSPVGSPCSDSPVEAAGYHWHTLGAVYRKGYLEKVGPWNESLTGSQDWEYQSRVKLAGGRGQFIDTVVGYWREHGGSRVGTKFFRPDYVRSVMLACDSILQHARKAGRCDHALERRLAKKLMLHALEYGANGYSAERNNCFKQAASCLSADSVFRDVIRLLPFTPTIFDTLLWRSLIRK